MNSQRNSSPVRRLLLRCATLLISLAIPVAQIHAQTQAAINAPARADFARADAELNKTYQAVLAKLPTAEKLKLKETQRAWVASRDAEAARAADKADGGSIAPTVRYGRMTQLTQERSEELKAMLDNGTASAGKTSASRTPAPSASPPESQGEQSVAQAGQAAAQTPSSTSPDKKWEYRSGDTPKLFHAGTNDVALEFSCSLGGTAPLWAPDSKRFAVICSGGKQNETLVYQQRDNQWEPLEEALGNGDELMERAGNIIDAQAKRKGLPKKTFLHMNQWTVEAEQWLDSSTLVVHASMLETVHGRDGEHVGPSFGADLLFTLKFDEAGKWKIVKTHEMTGKAAESPSRSTLLMDKILYRSPQGNYRIQASVDRSALWIVPAKDPSRRKPLLGADPDDRSPEEFSGSPDETWLFDNRQHEFYRDMGGLVFSALNKRQWFWKNALEYASKEFHFARRDIEGSSAGWSLDSARMLIHFKEDLQDQVQQRFAYFNTRTKAFEQTPYLRMVNTKLHSEKPYETFPYVTFAGEQLGSYVVFAEPVESPPSEAILKPRFTALDQEMNTLRGKELADAGMREGSNVELLRSEYDGWNKARDEAVQLYLPFAPDTEKESRKLQFLCDVTQREVNGLKEVAPSTASDKPVAQSPAASPP
ncbi:MAG: lysozyme inhibitor LprI family protein [Chthoniobacterales bacterium]